MPVVLSAINVDVLALLGLLALLAVLVVIAKMLLGRLRPQDADSAADTHNMWANFRDMYRSGELSEAEYELLRRQMVGRVKEEVDQRDRQRDQNDKAPARPPKR